MTPVTLLSNRRCGFEGHLVWQWQLNLSVGKQINLSKGHHLFWCSVSPLLLSAVALPLSPASSACHLWGGCHVVEKKVRDLAAESRQTQIAAHQHSSEDGHRLIAVVWAAALQLSQDRHWYLFLHANKTAVAYPTGTRWHSACCVYTSVLSASSPLSLWRSSHCFFSFKCPLVPLKQLLASKPLQTPGRCLWFVRKLSGMTTDRPENMRGRIQNSRMRRRVQKGSVWHVPTTWQTCSVLSIICLYALRKWPTSFFDAVLFAMINAHPACLIFVPQKSLACDLAILLLMGYKFSVDNMFLLGFLSLVVSFGACFYQNDCKN